MLKCSNCKDTIRGPHAVCQYMHAKCTCALHLQCLEAAKKDPKILLRCGCHHWHIDSFTQVEQDTIELLDREGDLTIISVGERVIKIGQPDTQNVIIWEERQQILVKYTNSSEDPCIYIPMHDDNTGNGWYIPSSYSEEMRCFFDALVRDGKLVAEFFRGDVGPKYTATR